MWVAEPPEIQTDLISAKALVKTTEQKIVPVRVLNLSGHEKLISKNTDVNTPLSKVKHKCQQRNKKDLVKMWRNE